MIDRLEAEQSEKEKLQKERHQMRLELSHDLKTPLATIKSSAAALVEGVVAEEEKERYYQTIVAKSDRVNTMADDMFTMLKMESSDYQPRLIRMDFCEFVRQICVEHYEEMEQAEFSVQIGIPEEPVWVLADDKLLARVVANFITNAVKYNKTGKEISVTVKREGDASAQDLGLPLQRALPESTAGMSVTFMNMGKISFSCGCRVQRMLKKSHFINILIQVYFLFRKFIKSLLRLLALAIDEC